VLVPPRPQWLPLLLLRQGACAGALQYILQSYPTSKKKVPIEAIPRVIWISNHFIWLSSPSTTATQISKKVQYHQRRPLPTPPRMYPSEHCDVMQNVRRQLRELCNKYQATSPIAKLFNKPGSSSDSPCILINNISGKWNITDEPSTPSGLAADANWFQLLSWSLPSPLKPYPALMPPPLDPSLCWALLRYSPKSCSSAMFVPDCPLIR
jgi:hypothetical protein